MNENRENNRFIGYEYKQVAAEPGQISFLIDGYMNFGWEIDEHVHDIRMEYYGSHPKSPHHRKSIIRMKRDRKIINKMELTRLQRNFEAYVEEIRHLEKEKNSLPSIVAITTGIIGTVFMAGSTFAVTANPPHIVLCILLAIPGFLGWILPYFLYKKGVRRQTEKISPLIEEKYDEIYEICEKGNKLISSGTCSDAQVHDVNEQKMLETRVK